MKKLRNKFKKGAASFYIVAFSTLILVVIATSFAMVVIAEVQRTSNDDLSQSAYDSALAGVEDAKLAYSNYRRCVAAGAEATLEDGYDPRNNSDSTSCKDIIYWMEHPDCDMVGHMVGRIPKNSDPSENNEVAVNDEANGEGSDLNQAYTCVQIKTTLDDYRATLSSSNQVRVVKVEFKGASAADISHVRFSWYSNREDTNYSFSNFADDGSRVTFRPTNFEQVAAPPTIELQMLQTAWSFTMDDLLGASDHGGTSTDRATVYLVPTDQPSAAAGSKSKNYTGIYDASGKYNLLSAKQMAETNDRYVSNVPFGVYCSKDGSDNSSDEFACSTVMELPTPTGGSRSNDTFMFVVTLPYAQPDTDFSLEFFCKSGKSCSDGTATVANAGNLSLAQIDGAQVVIDSTGKANDLYRRVEVRLESSDTSFPYPYYAIQLLGSGNDGGMTKDLTVTKECQFYDGSRAGDFNGSNCN